MPYKDPEKQREWAREYRKKNKEIIIFKKKEYYQKNKDKLFLIQKEWNNTEKGKKSNKISDWKRMGVICDDFDKLYDKYISTTHCENCNVELTSNRYNTSTTKCLDHDHETGLFRNILCLTCNSKRG